MFVQACVHVIQAVCCDGLCCIRLHHLAKKIDPQSLLQRPQSSTLLSEVASDVARPCVQAAADAAAEEARQKQTYERLIAQKQASLPPEPPISSEDVTRLLVRMPNGSRIERRCDCPAEMPCFRHSHHIST